MKILILTTIVTLILCMGLISCSSNTDKFVSGEENNPLVVFLVRHGEKVDHSDDAQLSAEGQERSTRLATILRNAEIDYVHSSNFIRTRDTAAPTTKGSGLVIDLYNHQDLPALVEKIRGVGGRHLVVGHSTTTTVMVELLGGKPGPAIRDEDEYDRLYIVTVGNDGNVSTVMMRY